VDQYEEQYGPVCAASSVATLTNYFTDAGIDTNKVLEYFCKHYMGIIYDTCQFVNRNVKKLKQNYERDLEAEKRNVALEEKRKEALILKQNNNQEDSQDLENQQNLDEADVDEDDANDLILSFSAKEMNKKKIKKKTIKSKSKNKIPKNTIDKTNIESSENPKENDIIDQNTTNSCLFSCNQITPEENDTALEPSKTILEYPILDPKALFNSFLSLKTSKTPLKEWYEENIPEQDFKIKGPIKAKLKKIRDNFRKLSKLCGT